MIRILGLEDFQDEASTGVEASVATMFNSSKNGD